MGKRIPKKTKKEAVRLYRSGLTLLETSLRLGVSQQSVKNWLKGDGVGTRGRSGASDLRSRKGRGASYGEKAWKGVVDLYESNIGSVEIGRRMGISTSGVQVILRRHGVELRTVEEGTRLAGPRISKSVRKYKINEGVFSGGTDRAKAWALGVIYGDGSIIEDKGVSYTLEVSGDKDVCLKVRSVLGSSHPVFQKGGCYILRIGSRVLAESLSAWGVVPRKSSRLVFPLGLPAGLDSHFYRGLFDADGCCGYSGKYFSVGIGLTSEKLIVDICRLMNEGKTGRKVTVSCRQPKKETHSPSWQVRVYSRRAFDFASWLYEDSDNLVRSDRKYGIFKKEAERLGVET